MQLNEKQKQTIDCCWREENKRKSKSKRKCQLEKISFWKPTICWLIGLAFFKLCHSWSIKLSVRMIMMDALKHANSMKNHFSHNFGRWEELWTEGRGESRSSLTFSQEEEAAASPLLELLITMQVKQWVMPAFCKFSHRIVIVRERERGRAAALELSTMGSSPGTNPRCRKAALGAPVLTGMCCFKNVLCVSEVTFTVHHQYWGCFS